MAKKVIIYRGARGIGDLLFTTPVARLLHEKGNEVHVAAWECNKMVYENNPYVTSIIINPDPRDKESFETWYDKLNAEFDAIVWLPYTVEKKYLHRTDHYFSDVPDLQQRRLIAQSENYYDSTLMAAGLEAQHILPELYASASERAQLERLHEQKTEQGLKVAIWNVRGSTPNKHLRGWKKWLSMVLEEEPKTSHYIVGDIKIDTSEFDEDSRVINVTGEWLLRTVMMISSIVDVVIGPESAVVNAAGCFTTPKVIFYSHSNPDNLGRYYENHFPILPSCEYHPCYLIPLNFKLIYSKEAREFSRKFETWCNPRIPGTYFHEGYRCAGNFDDTLVVKTILDAMNTQLVKRRIP